MAGIDKTYATFQEYQEYKEWCKGKEIIFPTGAKIVLEHYLYNLEEEDWKDEEYLPIMNTPASLDIYLIQNCPLQFVQNRMKEVYSEESFEKFKNLEFPLPLNGEYSTKRKIKIIKTGNLPLRNSGLNQHRNWWLQTFYNWGFHEESKKWVNYDDYYPFNTNTSHHKSIKSLIRFLRKQHLPKGLEFTLSRRYQGEDFLVKIK